MSSYLKCSEKGFRFYGSGLLSGFGYASKILLMKKSLSNFLIKPIITHHRQHPLSELYTPNVISRELFVVLLRGVSNPVLQIFWELKWSNWFMGRVALFLHCCFCNLFHWCLLDITAFCSSLLTRWWGNEPWGIVSSTACSFHTNYTERWGLSLCVPHS